MSIKTEIRGPVLVVTLDREKARNALNTEMREALIEVWQSYSQNDDLRVAILTGAGDKAFCAGADLKEVGEYYRSMTPIERREHGELNPGLGALTRNFDPRKPVIAAINAPVWQAVSSWRWLVISALRRNMRYSVCRKSAAVFYLAPVARNVCPAVFPLVSRWR